MDALGTLVLVLVWTLLALLVLVVLLALIPTRLTASAHHDRDTGLGGFVEARWAWGLISVRVDSHGVIVRLFGLAVFRPSAPARRRKAADKKRPRKVPGQRPALRDVLGLVRRVAASLRLRGYVRGRVGTGDPADTAWLYNAKLAAEQRYPRLDLSGLEVDWLQGAADVEASFVGRVWPAHLAVIGLSEWRRRRRRASHSLQRRTS